MIRQVNDEVRFVFPSIEGDGTNQAAKDEYDSDMKQADLKKTYKKMQ